MSKEVIKKIESEEWYQHLLENIKAIITETIYNSRMEIIRGKWLIGDEIIKEKRIYGKEKKLAEDLNVSTREIRRCVRFRRKYDAPDWDRAVLMLPEGKNITWNKIVINELPEPSKKIKLPEGKYGVIYADPPWPYPLRKDPKNLYGNIIYHYEPMTIKELCELEVKNLAADNSVLFIWVATNFLEESFKVIKEWGFDYKSNMVWIKEGEQGGIGWYVWGDHELLLIATKGSYLPKTKKLVSSVIKAPRGKHSEKPQIVYDIIEKLYPDDKYLELFARNPKKRKNWEYWGEEV